MINHRWPKVLAAAFLDLAMAKTGWSNRFGKKITQQKLLQAANMKGARSLNETCRYLR